MMPSDKELNEMRKAVEQLMPDLCNILSVSRVSDGQGGFTETWGTATANVPCRIDASSSRGVLTIRGGELLAGGAINEFSRSVVTLPYDTTISAENKLEINGQTFNVIIPDDYKSWKIDVRVIAELV